MAAVEHRIVCAIWNDIEQLLCSSSEAVDATIRGLEAVLPHPNAYKPKDLTHLSQLHLSSAKNLMTSMKLLAPAAFAAGTAHPNLTALEEAGSTAVTHMVSVLVELQLFHLVRAAALSAHKRRLIVAQLPLCEQPAAYHSLKSSAVGVAIAMEAVQHNASHAC